MIEKILSTIKTQNMISQNETLLISLSGGADSVALLLALTQLKTELKINKIHAAHINHNLRGEAAKSDENFVKNLCQNLNIPLKIFQADVKGCAKKENLGIEEAGRKIRHSILKNHLKEINAHKIAMGHNQDDVAETSLLNLCRGTGLKGLCGIPVVNNEIIRPLINVSRAEIEAYLAQHNQLYITDASNFSKEYTRNRIRNLVIPQLEEMVNPNVKEVIARNAAFIKADEDFLNTCALTALEKCLLKTHKTNLSLCIKTLNNQPLAMACRVIRLAILKLQNDGFLSDISGLNIQTVLDLAKGHSGRLAHLPGLIVRREYEQLIISTAQDKPQEFFYEITLNNPVYIAETGLTVSITVEKPQNDNNVNPKTPILHCTKAFECDIVEERLFLRSRKSGDRITLANNQTFFTKKLQDYFTDMKIPRHNRDTIPLLVNSANEIICILDKKGRTNANYSNEKYWASIWSEDNG